MKKQPKATKSNQKQPKNKKKSNSAAGDDIWRSFLSAMGAPKNECG